MIAIVRGVGVVGFLIYEDVSVLSSCPMRGKRSFVEKVGRSEDCRMSKLEGNGRILSRYLVLKDSVP